MYSKATEQRYWLDTHKFQDEATVILISDPERITEPNAKMVILDGTIFYPQGGGQPFDTGFLSNENGKFIVKEVRSKNEQVLHIGIFEKGSFKEGDIVHLEINKEKRLLHAKLHSAGHLLDIAMANIGLTHLKAGKGYHFPDGAYVEYEGTISSEDRDGIRVRLEEESNMIIERGSSVDVRMVEYERIGELCIDIPEYLSRNQQARIVTLAKRKDGKQSGCPCGGTHVKDVKEIGSLKIRKIVVKGGKSNSTRISYEV